VLAKNIIVKALFTLRNKLQQVGDNKPSRVKAFMQDENSTKTVDTTYRQHYKYTLPGRVGLGRQALARWAGWSDVQMD